MRQRTGEKKNPNSSRDDNSGESIMKLCLFENSLDHFETFIIKTLICIILTSSSADQFEFLYCFL